MTKDSSFKDLIVHYISAPCGDKKHRAVGLWRWEPKNGFFRSRDLPLRSRTWDDWGRIYAE
jgi:hypothetical protein